MKVTLPENISDITLDQFQKFNIIIERTDLSPDEFYKRKIEIFTGMNRADVMNLRRVDYKGIIDQIDTALNLTVEFKPTFKMLDVEFGFIPNLDKISMGEYIDLSKYALDVNDMHKMMAVLFRPILNKDEFGNYSIISYSGTNDYSDIMKGMPLSIVNGALVFFSNLADELADYIQKYTDQGQAKEAQRRSILKSGVGMLLLMSFQVATFLGWILSLPVRLTKYIYSLLIKLTKRN